MKNKKLLTILFSVLVISGFSYERCPTLFRDPYRAEIQPYSIGGGYHYSDSYGNQMDIMPNSIGGGWHIDGN